MRVNIYSEEITDRVTVSREERNGQVFTTLRFYLELPATVGGEQYRGPFMHGPDDDNSSAITFGRFRDTKTKWVFGAISSEMD